MIGDLRHRVTLQYPTRSPDGMGGFSVTWVDAATVYAAIWGQGASEGIEAAQTGVTIVYRIRIRYRSSMEASWRISWSNRLFNIVSILDHDMRHKWLDLICKEAR
jgi:SPP1 family predicted phage head-tail adaptor